MEKWRRARKLSRFRRHSCSSGRHATTIRLGLTYHGEGRSARISTGSLAEMAPITIAISQERVM